MEYEIIQVTARFIYVFMFGFLVGWLAKEHKDKKRQRSGGQV